MLAINTVGAMHLARAALPDMLERRAGRFVIVSSMAACVPSPGQSTYACCKAGVNAYFETLAAELSDRCFLNPFICICPIHQDHNHLAIALTLSEGQPVTSHCESFMESA